MQKIACSGIFFLAAMSIAHAAEPIGEWRDEDGNATIKIVDCKSRLWGVIASEKTPGTIDTKNPDKAKRNRTTLGMPILLNMAKVEDEKDKWEGEIYDPIRGKIFSSSIQVKSANALRVEGCLAMVFCGGQTWAKVQDGASGFTYAPFLKTGAHTSPAPTSPPKATTAPSPFPTPAGAPKTAAPAGAKTAVIADPATAQICALPEIVSAPVK